MLPYNLSRLSPSVKPGQTGQGWANVSHIPLLGYEAALSGGQAFQVFRTLYHLLLGP